MIPTREALQKLENLPTTAAIADELVSMGIKAKPRKGDDCAIAYYLAETTGSWVGVGLHYEGYDPNPLTPLELLGVVLVVGGQRRQLLSMPKVARFIHEFDEGAYPKLVLEEPQ